MIRPALSLLALCLPAAAEVVTLPDPYSEIPKHGSVVWSPLFQATWDAMNTHFGGKPEKIDPQNDLMSRLDSFRWEPENVMPEAGWKTWAGVATDEFLKKVNAEAAHLTGGNNPLFDLSEERDPDTIASFGLLDREVEFLKPLHRSVRVPMEFGVGKSSVHFFGTKGEQAAAYGEAIKVLAYRPVDGSHALEISCKEGDDKVILYLPAKSQNFASACQWIREWRQSWRPGSHGAWDHGHLHRGDELRIPYVSLNTVAEFSEQLNSRCHYQTSGDPWTIRRAEQRTQFELFEKGARVRLLASIELDPFAGPPPTIPRRFIYDRPFFVFLWRDQAHWPYLAVRVGDASILHKF